MPPKGSKGKGKEPNPPKRRKGSSSRGDHENEDELVEEKFINMNAQNLYYKVIKDETLLPSMVFDYTSLPHTSFKNLVSEFRNLGDLARIVGMREGWNIELVRLFYANLKVEKISSNGAIVLRSTVNGKIVVVSEDLLCKLLGIRLGDIRIKPKNEEGDDDVHDNEEEEEEGMEKFTSQVGHDFISSISVVTRDQVSTLDAMVLPGVYRLVHYAINRNICPKRATNNYISHLDQEILWHIHHGRKINWAFLILLTMKQKSQAFQAQLRHKTTKHKGLPYAHLITKILEHHKVSFEGGDFTPFEPSWLVTEANLKNMKLVKTRDHGWMYGPHAQLLGYELRTGEIIHPPTAPPPPRPQASRTSCDQCKENTKSIKKMEGWLKKIMRKLDCYSSSSEEEGSPSSSGTP